MYRDDQRSQRGDPINSHKQRYCYCGGLFTLSTLVTSLVRLINLWLAVFVATQTTTNNNEDHLLFVVPIFTSALAFYQLTCLVLQWTPEERVNPYGGRSLYEFTKSQHETIKLWIATMAGIIMAICLPYLAIYTNEPQWRHAGGGVLLFVLPAILDYRVRRSLAAMMFGIRPENAKDEDEDEDDDDDYYENSSKNTATSIDFSLLFLWMGKYVQMPIELGPAICYAILLTQEQQADQTNEDDAVLSLLLSGRAEVIWIVVSMVLTIGLIGIGVFSRIKPGVCWIDNNTGKVQIPVNASEAELSYAGYLAALLDKGVVYVAAGNVAKDIPLLLRWISYSGLPQAGRWGEVLGHGNGETGAELRVEKCFGKSILYEYAGSIYIQLGDKVFEFSEGYLEPASSSFALLHHATPVNGCWELT